MQDKDITSDGFSDAPHMSAADPMEAVGGEAQPSVESLSLADINKATGKNFPTKEAALKSISDTLSYVGKKKEDIEKEVLEKAGLGQVGDLAKELESIRKDMFYKDNPDYAPYRKIIERMGGDPMSVTASPDFQEIFTKAAGFDKTQQLKTVLESNPRLASSRDSHTRAKDLLTSNRGNPHVIKAEVDDLAVRGVMDAYDIK